MPLITSVHNPRVNAAARLRDSRHRQKQGRILIDGLRELGRAVDAGVGLVEVFVCEPRCASPEAQALLSRIGSSQAEVLHVTEPVFAKLAFGHRAEGVLAVARTPDRRLEDLVLPDNPLVAVLEGLQKPGNVGAVLRSADAAGVAAILVADGGTDLYNPNAIRTSLGTIFSLPVCAATTQDTIDWLRRKEFTILAARVDGARLFHEADYRGPAAIVLGSEAAGLSPAWSGPDVQAVRLPMLGAADSLNVSAAAAVLFYEAWRQRNEE